MRRVLFNHQVGTLLRAERDAKGVLYASIYVPDRSVGGKIVRVEISEKA